MFTKKETAWIIISVLIVGFIIGWSEQPDYSPVVFLIALAIILVNVFAKKIASSHYSIKIEHKIWEFRRWGWYERSYFKKPVPVGLIIPFFLSFISLGMAKIFLLLQFNAENLPKKRALRKRGAYRYSEINESDLAFTAAWGFWALILLAIVGHFINSPELSKYAIYYGLWNLLPISNLDGTKLFFGSFFNWILLAVAYIISLIIMIIF